MTKVTNEILRMADICKAFSGIKALDGVSFSCNRGEVHVLAGENGAGKSTLLKILAGIYHADSGEIYINDQKVRVASPAQSQSAGVAMVFQELTLIDELTVEENIFLHREPRNKLGLVDRKKLRQDVNAAMERFGIELEPGVLVSRLPVALKQMTEILKVLVREPEIVILDEPTSALATQEVQQLFEIVENLSRMGKSIVFISHRLDEVFRIGDRITVLKDGKLVGTRALTDLNEDELIRMMIGRTLEGTFPPKQGTASSETVFSVKGLSTSDGKLQDITFEVNEGEIFGIAGLQGHGQSELLTAIAGLQQHNAEEVALHGKPLHVHRAHQAIAEGIALVPADRKSEGLMLDLSVRHNLSIGSLDKRKKGIFIDGKAESVFTQESVAMLSIKVANTENPVHTLSGGNQQKVVLGKVLALKPKLILFDEPTRGIDVEAKREFYRLMLELAQDGVGVIMNSSDLVEVIGMCDRVLVMYEGKVSGILSKHQMTEESILRYAMGITQPGVASDAVQ